MRIFLTFLIAGLLGWCSPKAHADISQQLFSFNQVFDVQWHITSNVLYASSFNYLYASQPTNARLTAAQTNAYSSAGNVIRFFPSSTNPGTYGLGVYDSTGQTLIRVLDNYGTVYALASGAIFYIGGGSWGTLFTTSQGYGIGSSGNWTVTQMNPTQAQLQAYTPPTTQPLGSGQQAPQYTSSITAAEQNRVNSAESRLAALTKNSIYVDQVASNNIVSINQNTRDNQVDGVGATSAPIQGTLNNITIRQGDTAARTGHNLIDLAVQGTGSNTLNLNQGTDTAGNVTGQDAGYHYQLINVSGYNNTITTQQQSTGGTVGNYLEANVTGNYNTVGITQTGGSAQKQVFSTVTGNNNTINATQTGASGHFLDVTLNGNGNSAVVNQSNSGATGANAATINLTNAGGPASVNLTQTGGQVYNILSTCVTVGGCATTTIKQGN